MTSNTAEIPLDHDRGDEIMAYRGKEAVFDAVERHFTEADEREFGPAPSRSFIESEFFNLEPLESVDVLDAYWINEPFVYATVVFDERREKPTYRYFEPELTDFERHVQRELERTIRHVMRREEPISDDSAFEQRLEELVADHAATVDSESLYKIFYYIMRNFIGYGQLDPLMQDPYLEDISCDGPTIPVFIYHPEYEDLETNLIFEASDLDLLVHRLSQQINTHVSAAQPQASGILSDGSRAQLTIASDISVRGSNFTIRRVKETPFTPVDLIKFGTFSLEEMAYLWFAVEHNMSIMFVGPTASGKTTSMNALSLFLKPDKKVVSIEEVRELSVPHNNWVSYVTREVRKREQREGISMYDLLESALHQRPEYILVGEIRANPTVVRTFFQSIFTGHPGATTFHANSAQNAMNRLTSEPLDITEQMASALDIIAVQHQVRRGSGDRIRRNLSLTLVGSDAEEYSLSQVFRWNPQTDTIEATVDSLKETQVFEHISDQRGWELDQVQSEFERRRELLSYLVESDITEYERVVAAFLLFYRNKERVFEQIEAKTFEPPALPDLL